MSLDKNINYAQNVENPSAEIRFLLTIVNIVLTQYFYTWVVSVTNKQLNYPSELRHLETRF